MRRLLLTVAMLGALRSLAHADGALPGSLSILTPAALPHDVALATNFGLVLTHDDGQHWVWSCEQSGNAFGTLYQQGAAPLNRIYTISADHLGMPQLAFSDDESCSWGVAASPDHPAPIVDAFPDPSSPSRVVAVAVAPTDGGSVYEILESSDAGASFSQLRYTAAAGDFVTGLEIARSDPQTIYMTLGHGTPPAPTLVRSTDGGQHWTGYDLSGLGASLSVRLFAIDPTDASRVYLRVLGGGNDSFAVATIDASDSIAATKSLTLTSGVITAFARLGNGHLFVGGTVEVTPAAYLSVDNGTTFQQLPTPPTLKGASARGTTLYAVVDDTVEGYAVGTSSNEGQSWQPFMRFDQIQAIQRCVADACQYDCLMRASLGQWSEDFCAAPDPYPPPPPDGGAPADGGADAAVDAPGGSPDGGTTPGKSGGCGCDGSGGVAGLGALALLSLLTAATGRRRRDRGLASREDELCSSERIAGGSEPL
jgi:hypothetical protein